MAIIDGRVRLRTESMLKFWDAKLNPAIRDYIDKYHMQDRLSVLDVSRLINEAQNLGVERLLVVGSTPEENTHVLDLAREYAAIIPVGGINLNHGIRSALDEVARVRSKDAAAIDINFMNNCDVNSKALYAIYGYCEMQSIPIIIHSGIHYVRGIKMWQAQPQYFDEIAVDFPQMRIILSHGGNGFGPSVLAVAQRHPNIFLEFSAMRPKYMAPEFIQAANTYLKDRCIFGTDYPLTDFESQIKLWQYSLREEVWEQFFYKNILRALF